MTAIQLVSPLTKQVAVACIAVSLTFVLSSLIASLLVPNLADVALYNYNPALRPNIVGHEREVRNAILVVRYIANPLAGAFIGVFIGLCQKSRATFLAIVCWLPRTTQDVIHGSLWLFPWFAVVRYLPGILLTVLSCVLAVELLNVLRNLLKEHNGMAKA